MMEGPLLGGKFWRVPSIVDTGKGVVRARARWRWRWRWRMSSKSAQSGVVIIHTFLDKLICTLSTPYLTHSYFFPDLDTL